MHLYNKKILVIQLTLSLPEGIIIICNKKNGETG
jgi:hypothetical protein